jgi:DNA-binding CsgD family transcriptional regulator
LDPQANRRTDAGAFDVAARRKSAARYLSRVPLDCGLLNCFELLDRRASVDGSSHQTVLQMMSLAWGSLFHLSNAVDRDEVANLGPVSIAAPQQARKRARRIGVEKINTAGGGREASAREAREESESRLPSGVVRMPAVSFPAAAITAGSDFLGTTVNAIRTVVAASAVCCIVQPNRARMPHGFCYEAEGEQPLFLRDNLTALIDEAQRRPGQVYVDSASRDLGRPFDTYDLFGHRADGDRAWMVLRDGVGVFGIVGLARGAEEGDFSAAEQQKLEELAPLLNCGLRAELDSIDSRCELAVVRALGANHGTCLLFERDLERVVWASSHGKSVDWTHAIEPVEELLARSIEELLEAQTQDEVLPTPPRLPLGMVVAVAPVADTPFGSRCIAVGILATAQDYRPIALLSARERSVARLLIKGYEPANIAAITGIAEHTVRTYIRRAYKKLGVCRRADLVRCLLAPEAGLPRR